MVITQVMVWGQTSEECTAQKKENFLNITLDLSVLERLKIYF